MLQRLTLTLIALAVLTSAGCQSYTRGIQQTIVRADETAVISALRSISVAERAYNLTNAQYGTLQQLVDGGFIDARYGSSKPVKDYVITINVSPKTADEPDGSFTCTADPDGTAAKTGRHFYVDAAAEIHVNPTQPATASDPMLQ